MEEFAYKSHKFDALYYYVWNEYDVFGYNDNLLEALRYSSTSIHLEKHIFYLLLHDETINATMRSFSIVWRSTSHSELPTSVV